jgi:hypothetical protein
MQEEYNQVHIKELKKLTKQKWQTSGAFWGVCKMNRFLTQTFWHGPMKISNLFYIWLV